MESEVVRESMLAFGQYIVVGQVIHMIQMSRLCFASFNIVNRNY